VDSPVRQAAQADPFGGFGISMAISEPFRRWFKQTRTIAAWFVLPAFVSMFIAHQQILAPRYCCMPWPIDAVNRPPAWIFYWRNYSLLLVVIALIISLPRWQSLVATLGIVVFFFLYGSQ